MQPLEDSQAFIDLFPNSPTLNAVNTITSKLLEMESNGDQWLKEQVLFSKNWLLSMWYLYSWTNVAEMAKWSTTGFSLQCQSLINQTSDENYGNHQSSPALVIKEENIEKYGFASLWMPLPLT